MPRSQKQDHSNVRSNITDTFTYLKISATILKNKMARTGTEHPTKLALSATLAQHHTHMFEEMFVHMFSPPWHPFAPLQSPFNSSSSGFLWHWKTQH